MPARQGQVPVQALQGKGLHCVLSGKHSPFPSLPGRQAGEEGRSEVEEEEGRGGQDAQGAWPLVSRGHHIPEYIFNKIRVVNKNLELALFA